MAKATKKSMKTATKKLQEKKRAQAYRKKAASKKDRKQKQNVRARARKAAKLNTSYSPRNHKEIAAQSLTKANRAVKLAKEAKMEASEANGNASKAISFQCELDSRMQIIEKKQAATAEEVSLHKAYIEQQLQDTVLIVTSEGEAAGPGTHT